MDQVMQLTRDMYWRRLRREENPFGICWGQIRPARISHNGRWFNKAGERLGWGDLSMSDLQRVAVEILASELFIVVAERNALLSQPEEVQRAPGVEHVAEYADYIVGRDKIFFVDRYGNYTPVVAGSLDKSGFKVITPDDAKRLIAEA